MSVIVVICQTSCDFVYILELDQHKQRRWTIVIYYRYHVFHSPDGAFYFAQLKYADYVAMLRIKWPCLLLKK